MPACGPLTTVAMPKLSTLRIVTASLLAAAGLAVVGWFDYDATRAELLGLLRGQAETLRQTVAAAARSNEAAGAVAAAQVTERLLDNARLLAEIDRKGGLTAAFLDDMAARNRLFRVTVFAADGTRERSGGGPGGGRAARARARAGRAPAAAPGSSGAGGERGRRPGVSACSSGEEREAVGQVHAARGGRRRARLRRRAAPRWGGNRRSTPMPPRWKRSSARHRLETLVRDIGSSTPQLAYLLIERGTDRVTHGELPADLPPAPAGSGLSERALEVAGRPVLEFAGAVAFGAGQPGTLRLGLRLDEVKRAERRMVTRLAASLAAALLLSLFALGTVWLRQAYATLSEKHALAEAALRRRDRLSAMGELASTVAHEVRNPLNAIAMSSQRLRREFLSAVAPAGAGVAGGEPLPGPGPEDRQELEPARRRRRRDQAHQRHRAAVPGVRAAASPGACRRRSRRRGAGGRRGRAFDGARTGRAVGRGHERGRRGDLRRGAAAAGPGQPREERGRGDALGRARGGGGANGVARATRYRSATRAPASPTKTCRGSSTCTSPRRPRGPAWGWPSRSRS